MRKRNTQPETANVLGDWEMQVTNQVALNNTLVCRLEFRREGYKPQFALAIFAEETAPVIYARLSEHDASD